MFDEDNANFLAFHVRESRKSENILFLDHEGIYSDPPFGMTLTEYLEPDVKSYEGALDDVPPFQPQTYSDPDPEPQAEIWVTHSKFGRGRVTKRDRSGKREKWVVEFEDGEVRKLLADFLVVED